MSKHDPRVTLGQILEFITEVETYTRGETLDTLLTNQMKMRAFERVMPCIGEAVKRLRMDFRNAFTPSVALPDKAQRGGRHCLSFLH